jgi:hypothetical protein
MPYIKYQTVEHLTRTRRPTYGCEFLSVTVCYETRRRDRATGNILPRWRLPTQTEANRRFDDARIQWQRSHHFGAVQSTLKKHRGLIPSGIRKIVAFACGTMAHKEDIAESSKLQHALIIFIRDFLSARDGAQAEILCYAQDPAYSEIDQNILAGSNITIIDDPRGFLEVDETTVVISFSPDVPVRQIIADIARPALMIWDRIIAAAEDDSL